MSLAKKDDKLIYNEGKIEDEKFAENSINPYEAHSVDSIEYFYIFEDKLVNKHENHDKIVKIKFNRILITNAHFYIFRKL
jgi:hypothetical protein